MSPKLINVLVRLSILSDFPIICDTQADSSQLVFSKEVNLYKDRSQVLGTVVISKHYSDKQK